MTLQVGDRTIEASKEVEQLPRELIDFAIKNRSTNGNYYWNQHDIHGIPYRLERIQVVDRIWNWCRKSRALSIKFTFSQPQRDCVGGKLTTIEKDNFCYQHNMLDYDFYYANIVEGTEHDICQKLVEMNLDNTFPANLLSYVEQWD